MGAEQAFAASLEAIDPRGPFLGDPQDVIITLLPGSLGEHHDITRERVAERSNHHAYLQWSYIRGTHVVHAAEAVCDFSAGLNVASPSAASSNTVCCSSALVTSVMSPSSAL